MVKVFLTVRNRLSLTSKCIEALERHSRIEHHIYVYNNLTNYIVDEHFKYFCDLYKKSRIDQVVFNTQSSTFNAFSKAVACNQFGFNHEQDPKKDEYDFLLFLDNDVIVLPGWDITFKKAWADVKKNKLKNVKVISQAPGGIMKRAKLSVKIADVEASVGKCGGSGFWSIKSDFFRDIGYSKVKLLVGRNKGHDQHYWRKLDKITGSSTYSLALHIKLALHAGSIYGSICNVLTSGNEQSKKDEKMKFKNIEESVGNMNFDEFFSVICKDKKCGIW